MATLLAAPRPTRDFTMIRNSWLDDPDLSAEQLAVLCWLTRHQDGREVTEGQIMARFKRGRNAVRQLLRQLASAGYLVCRQLRDTAGRVGSALWRLTSPDAVKAQVTPSTDRPVNGAELGEHDETAGHTVDRPSGRRFSLPIEDEPEDEKTSTRARPHATQRTHPKGRLMPKPVSKIKGQLAMPEVSAAAMAARTDQLVRDQVQQITDEWVQHCAKTPPSRIRQQVRAVIHELVTDGIDPDDIRRGCASWMTKGLPPSVLPSEVNRVMNARPATTTRSRLAEVDGVLMSQREIDALAVQRRFEAAERGGLRAIGGAW
jgi:hypothetical protein